MEDNIVEDLGANPILFASSRFSEDYKQKLFLVWYNAGKPGANVLHGMIPEPETNWGRKPSTGALSAWIRDEFIPHAAELDNSLITQLDNTVVQEKLEMLKRHALTGMKMQNIAIEWLEEHQDELSPASAVRLLVAGIEVERKSRGIPEAIEEMVSKSDEDLLDELKKLVTEGSQLLETGEEEK